MFDYLIDIYDKFIRANNARNTDLRATALARILADNFLLKYSNLSTVTQHLLDHLQYI